MSNSLITAVFSPHDEISRSLLAIHLGRPDSLLIDLGLPFGGLDTLLNVFPEKSWADLVPVAHDMSSDLLSRAVTPIERHGGLLAAPALAATSEGLTPAVIGALLARARERYDRIVLDVSPALREAQLTALTLADRIALVVRADIPGLVIGQRCLAWLHGLGLRDRVRIVTTATVPPAPVSAHEIAQALGPVFASLPWDPAVTARARNLGEPWRSTVSPIGQALAETARRWEQDWTSIPLSEPRVSRWRQTGDLIRSLFARTTLARPT